MEQARKAAGSILARTAYFGTIGLMIALPMVAGAYLGLWLDSHTRGFSFSWTISLIVVGLAAGVIGVVRFIKDTWS